MNLSVCKIAIVAALEREVAGFTRRCRRAERTYDGRRFIFYEQDDIVVVCGGIGPEAARRAAEAIIMLYQPALLQSVGFAGALNAELRAGDLFTPSVVIDARDGSRIPIEGEPQTGQRTLVSFMAVAGAQQKASLAQAYGAQAVDMEAAAVAVAARAHGIRFGTTKVISDELDFEVPGMDRFMDAQGRFKTASFAAFVAVRPWLWSRVARLAINSRKAAKMLVEHMLRLRQQLSQARGQVPETTPLSPHPVGAGNSSHAGGRK
jgi:adenosylhomocysteine nucleosidase